MYKNFFISYYGNKYNEIKEFINFIPPYDTIDKIIEPFGGTFAFTRYIEAVKPQNKKLKYVVNDNSKYLYKDFIKHEYIKIYQQTKKKTYHLIVTNY